MSSVVISARGEQRVHGGHPWIYRADVVDVDAKGGDIVQVVGPRKRTLGYALFLPLGPDWTYLQMLPTILLVGVAFSLAFGTLMIVATDGIAEPEQGLASGLQYVSLQFGAAVGLAVVAAVNVAATDGASERALLDGFQAALFVPVAAVGLGLVVTATALPGWRRTSVIGACSST